jgi:hypothetical protein
LQRIEFSLANGSALIRQLRTLRPFHWIPQKLKYQIALAVLIAWAPLLVFTAKDGLALGSKVQIPFLLDFIQYARFLVALPCAIALGRYINPRLENVLNSFLRAGIVRKKDFTAFQNIISRTRVLTNSVFAELVILAVVYSYTSFGLHRQVSADITSWHRNQMYTAADWWFLWVSMPVLLFAGFLWGWRLVVWAYLLFRISRLDLRLVATHPDRVGGLNFVNVGMRRLALLVFAISSILCASIGEEILFNGASLHAYELELALFFLLCVAVILGPLVVFTPTLVRSKLADWGKYGPLAGTYVQGFDDKWIVRTGYPTEELLGTSDIQSLADLRNSYSGIGEMRTLLPNKTTVGILAIAYVIPVVPLLASVISLRLVVSELYGLLLK